MLVIRGEEVADWEDIPDRKCSMLSAESYSLVDSKKV